MSENKITVEEIDGSFKADTLGLVACDTKREMAIFKLGKLVARQMDFERKHAQPSGPVAPEPTNWGAVEYRAWKGQIEHVKQVKAEAVAPAGGETPDWRKMCIVEISCENQSVSDYIKHWEGRTLKAEAQLALLESERDGLLEELNIVLKWLTESELVAAKAFAKSLRSALAGAPSVEGERE